ncbi:MAG: hypothetical protein PHG27_06625 [Massilibacteroides sp.]|nr:hypothetical protein [Massilibacteroides sp.]MDD3063546.1 hypothetical protein [Massilibacteroides sp.]MDD4115254.1 hypothetical protein [Massilibacteroides sp.]MDD4661368.1 hypothetical protein [Massilibacteroides sp.]
MKQLIVCLEFIYWSAATLSAQNQLRYSDLRSIGMGENGVTHSLVVNPACLGLSTSQSIDINFFNKYNLKELTTLSAIYANAKNVFPFGFLISSFGYDKYRETMFRLILSKRIFSRWIIGVSIQYDFLQSELWEEDVSKLSTDIGILFKCTDNLLIGLSIIDFPSHLFYNESIDNKDFNYYNLQTGFQYLFINNLLIDVSADYEKNGVLRLHAGLEYLIYDCFHVRAGLHTDPLNPSFGLGLDISSFQLNVAAVYHTQLGIGSGVGLVCFF